MFLIDPNLNFRDSRNEMPQTSSMLSFTKIKYFSPGTHIHWERSELPFAPFPIFTIKREREKTPLQLIGEGLLSLYYDDNAVHERERGHSHVRPGSVSREDHLSHCLLPRSASVM
jgi:hypothetical protein